jgi:hypothetical protein
MSAVMIVRFSCEDIVLTRLLLRPSAYPKPLLLRCLFHNARSGDSVVGIATGYGLDEPGGRSSSPGSFKNFAFCTSSRPALGFTQPLNQLIPGNFPRGKAAGA